MKTYFTSDFHFGEPDERLKLFGRDRLGLSSSEIDDMIINNYNSVIKDNDLVYILGDIAKSPEQIKRLSELNGRKFLIVGNYDENYINELTPYFEKIVHDDTVMIHGKRVYLNHYPNKAKVEYFNLCGHIHGLWQVQRNTINVSVDAWGFKPISDEEIAFKIEAIEKFYDENVFAGELDANKVHTIKDKVVITPDTNPSDYKDNKLLFLAGPIKGSLNWRKQLIYSLNKIDKDFIIANPQMLVDEKDFDLNAQIEWEQETMVDALEHGVLVFWLAKQEEETKGAFARTSRFEIGEFLERYKNNDQIGNLVIGIDPDFDGRDYIINRIETETSLEVFDNFESLVEAINVVL